jgi:hypothetical protein
MSLEKKFQSENQPFQFASCGLFVVLYGVSGSVSVVLVCALMLFSVKFHVAMREV